ncbi:hypothetical protein [Spirosoma foliorum]|uniref:Uncharacterized protein n=1 Tax=Spirosoma foliorum TaxID=2710596 RepID=A0A7G5GPT9_9BACT|nr:hypothetical protein [Spirosoma foliorum]QMW00881.1 hypothetical protein H3H32_23260 [Spirosoma foliorum]
MNSNEVNQPLSLSEKTASCQHEHQHWQQIIRQQEEEIRNLRSLLLDVMNLYNCRSLRHDAVDYYRDLNQLQTKLTRLNRDLICEGVECQVVLNQPTCTNTHFGLSATIERHATVLANEFSRIKDGCLQFLSGMMSLNLL